MAITGGWTPLSGPKVPAEATHPSAMTSPLRGIAPAVPIPPTADDGFLRDSCCAPVGGGCGGSACADTAAVNVSSGALLYRYRIPENTIPIEVSYESDGAGVSSLGTGWVSTYHRSISRSKTGSVVTVTCGDGCRVGYTQDATATFTYYPSKGFDHLVEQDPASTLSFTETLPSGLKYKYDLGSSGRLTNVIDPDGRLWTIGYSGASLSYVQNHRSRRVTLNYDGSGKISSIEDTAGRRTTIGYTAGKPSTITGPEGCVHSYEYDAGGRLEKISDPEYNHTLVTFSSGKVQTVRAVDPDSPTKDLVTTFSYSSGVTRVENPKADPTTYTFDTTEKVLTKIQDAEGDVTTFTWDSDLRLTTMVNPRGYATKLIWQAVSGAAADTRRRLEAIDPASTGYRTTFAYGTGYELQSVTDPRGYRTTYTYTNRHLRTLQDARGGVTTWNYTSNVLTSIEDPHSYRTTFTFGANGQVATIRDAESRVTTFGYDAAANATLVIDALGNRVTTTFDAANRRTSVTDQESHTTSFAYTGCGLLRSVTDPRGYRTTYSYDHNGARTEIEDALGKRTTFSYDKARNPVAVKNARGFVTTSGYDKVGRRVTVDDGLNQRTTFTYDPNGNPLTATDPSGAVTSRQYDSLDRLEVSIDALGYRTTFAYDESSNRTKVTDARGNVTTSVFDQLNRVTEVRRADGGIATTVFDAAGNVQATVDARGNRTTTTYDKTSHAVEVRDSVGNRTTFAYDAVYNRISVKNARGAITTSTFDKAHRLSEVQDPLGNRTTHTYDAAGNPRTLRDAAGSLWTFTVDQVNRRTAAQNPLSETTTTTYDEVGNVVEIRYANGERVTQTYDALNRLRSVKNPAGFIATNVYDDVGRTRAVVDFNENRSTQTFDARGMLSSRKSAEGIVVTHTYDKVGNRETVVDGEGHTTTYSYSSVDLLSEVRDPLSSRTTYTYDKVGNRETRRDPDANVTTYTYDPRNLRTGIQYSTGGRVTLSYDAVGNLTTLQDDRGTHVRTFDLRDSVLSLLRGDGLRLTYTYDAVGRRRTIRDDADGLQTHNYDAASRLSTLVNPTGETTTFGYDARGRLRLIEYHNNTNASYTYDATGGVGVAKGSRRSDGMVFSLQSYTLDKAGRTTAIHATGQSAPESRTTWTFDKDYRLTVERRWEDDHTTEYHITYAYDRANNRTRMEEPEPTGTTTYTYDERNALDTVEHPGETFSVYTHDNRGNRTFLTSPDGDVATYTYDAESRLTQLEDGITPEGPKVRTYRYNAFGERFGWTDEASALITEVWDLGRLLSQNKGGSRTRFSVAPLPGGPRLISQASTPQLFLLGPGGTTDVSISGTPPEAASTARFIATAFGVCKRDITAYSGQLVVPKFRANLGWTTETTALSGPIAALFSGGPFYDPAVGLFLSESSLLGPQIGSIDDLSGRGVDTSLQYCSTHGCCCCAMSAFIQSSSPTSVPHYCGHDITVTIVTDWYPWSKPTSSDCTLEWWEHWQAEKNGVPELLGPQVLRPTDMYALARAEGYSSPIIDAWESRERLCPSYLNMTQLPDTAAHDVRKTSGARYVRVIGATIIAKSSPDPGCPCLLDRAEVSFKQTIEISRGRCVNARLEIGNQVWVPRSDDVHVSEHGYSRWSRRGRGG